MSLAFPSSMLYQQIPYSGVLKKEFVDISPVSGTSFGPNETIEFNINSSSAMLDVSRSYLKITTKLSGGTVLTDTSNTASMSAYGSLATTIKSVRTTLGGVEIERVDNYNNLIAYLYNRSPESHKNALKRLEAYRDTDVLAGSVAKGTNGRRACHALKTALLDSTKSIPLPWVRGGLNIELTLSTLNEFLAANTVNATAFALTDVRYCACFITPTADYFNEVNQMLSGGKVMTIPVEVTKSYRKVPSALTSQITQINTGFISSLNEIIATFRTTSNLSSASADSFTHISAGSKSYSFKIGSERFPKNFEVNCQNAIATATPSPESYMQELVAYDNNWAAISHDYDIDENKNNALYYNFKADAFASSSNQSVEDGLLEMQIEYNSDPSANTLDIYTRHSAKVLVSISEVAIDSKTV